MIDERQMDALIERQLSGGLIEVIMAAETERCGERWS
jgi:hypothetical protein